MWLLRHIRAKFSPMTSEDLVSPVVWLEGAMQRRYVGGIDDFAKFALLRHVMKHRRLAVCWYLTGENEER